MPEKQRLTLPEVASNTARSSVKHCQRSSVKHCQQQCQTLPTAVSNTAREAASATANSRPRVVARRCVVWWFYCLLNNIFHDTSKRQIQLIVVQIVYVNNTTATPCHLRGLIIIIVVVIISLYSCYVSSTSWIDMIGILTTTPQQQ